MFNNCQNWWNKWENETRIKSVRSVVVRPEVTAHSVVGVGKDIGDTK